MHGRMLAHELFHGINGVEPPWPERFVVPGVFADGDGQANAVQLNHLLGLGWQEIALLIENVIEGQEPLVLFEKQLAPVEQYSGVEGGPPPHRRRPVAGETGFSVIAPRRQRNACQHGRGQLARSEGQFVYSGTAAGKEALLLKKVGGRIAADGELGEDGEARTLLRRSAADSDDSFEISGEISNCRIDLGQRDLHNNSLNGSALTTFPKTKWRKMRQLGDGAPPPNGGFLNKPVPA